MAKQKHLTEDERRSIEDSLNRRDSLAYIAGAIGKDKTTISREIKKQADGSGIQEQKQM